MKIPAKSLTNERILQTLFDSYLSRNTMKYSGDINTFIGRLKSNNVKNLKKIYCELLLVLISISVGILIVFALPKPEVRVPIVSYPFLDLLEFYLGSFGRFIKCILIRICNFISLVINLMIKLFLNIVLLCLRFWNVLVFGFIKILKFLRLSVIKILLFIDFIIRAIFSLPLKLLKALFNIRIPNLPKLPEFHLPEFNLSIFSFIANIYMSAFNFLLLIIREILYLPFFIIDRITLLIYGLLTSLSGIADWWNNLCTDTDTCDKKHYKDIIEQLLIQNERINQLIKEINHLKHEN